MTRHASKHSESGSDEKEISNHDMLRNLENLN